MIIYTPRIEAQPARSRGLLPLRPGCPITNSDIAEARAVSRAAIANGFASLKVHSSWSPHVGEDSAGKQPCTEIVDGQKKPWSHGGHSLNFLMRRTPATANTGILLGTAAHLVVFDVDPRKDGSPAERRAFALAALQVLFRYNWQLRRALIRLREPGSVLLLFRCDRLVKKSKAAGEAGAVELLGDGQQILIHGYHPISRQGAPVRWTWMHNRSPWTVPADDLPIVTCAELAALMQEIEAAGILGPPIARPTTTTVVVGQRSAAAYPATWRLHALFAKHNDLVRPAVRELVQEIGAEGCGRHDAIVAIVGRLVHQKWTDEQVHDFMTPLINASFGDGDWAGEVEAALDHARRRNSARFQTVRGTTWTR